MFKSSKAKFNISFFITLLLHIFILLSFTSILTFQLQPERYKKSPQYYVPAYFYQNHTASQNLISHTSARKQTEVTSKAGIKSPEKSILAMSQDFIHQSIMDNAIKNLHNEEPILMIGDPTISPDPFIKLLARSLSAHFRYPSMEGNMGLHGKVLVQFVLHPEGYYSDIQIVESSENQNFDAAALYAVNTAPDVRGIKQYLDKPKRFIVGFIFD